MPHARICVRMIIMFLSFLFFLFFAVSHTTSPRLINGYIVSLEFFLELYMITSGGEDGGGGGVTCQL